MLLQSHTPGVISLLPALPPALPSALPSGHVYGLNARGNVIVSMAWRNNKLQASELLFQSDHFWLRSQQQGSPSEHAGFYHFHTEDHLGDMSMIITAPNKLKLFDGYSYYGTISACSATLHYLHGPSVAPKGDFNEIIGDVEPLQHITRLTFVDNSFPCVIALCEYSGTRTDSIDCANELQIMQQHNQEQVW